MIQIDMDMPKSCADCPCGDAQDGWCYVHNEVLERMGNGYPSIETRPDWCPLKEVKHGKWIRKSTGGWRFTLCSECGYVEWNETNNYCPKCGADMREES